MSTFDDVGSLAMDSLGGCLGGAEPSGGGFFDSLGNAASGAATGLLELGGGAIDAVSGVFGGLYDDPSVLLNQVPTPIGPNGANPPNSWETRTPEEERMRQADRDAQANLINFIPGVGDLLDGWGVVSGIAQGVGGATARDRSDGYAQAELSFLGLIPGVGFGMDVAQFAHDARRSQEMSRTGGAKDLPSFEQKWRDQRWGDQNEVPTA